jgi:ketosteroid isomerase-like protein
VAAPAPKTEPVTKPISTAPVAVAPATTPAPAAKPANDNEEIVKTLKAWAAAWSAKDVPAYLGFYAKDFKTPGGESRSEWEAARKMRIQAPKSITVALDSIKVRMSGATTALVTFHQSYKSDTLKAMGATKTIAMTKSGGSWQILEERVGS